MPAIPPSVEPVPHLLVPFARASAPECQALLQTLKLPRLEALLAQMVPETFAEGSDQDLSLPHERARALAMGIVQADGSPWPDGRIPWAAALSDAPELPQAWFSPCHFQVGMDQVSLVPGEQLALDDANSRPLFEALAPFCREDGITLRFETPTRWHASGEVLRGIAYASLDRVSGRSVDGWLHDGGGAGAGLALLKRLQSEAQMLFYTHPVNDARDAARQASINGFWVHGAGAAACRARAPTDLRMPDALRQAALQADWPAWRSAWEALDANDIPPLLDALRQGQPVRLTLCGERSARTWHSVRPSAAGRLGRAFKQWWGKQPAWQSIDPL
ncbi:MAG: phosphoglycerate mutase [Hydrogenophaga sp.]